MLNNGRTYRPFVSITFSVGTAHSIIKTTRDYDFGMRKIVMKNNVNWSAFVRIDEPHKHMLNKFIHRVEFDVGKLISNRAPFVVNTDNLKTNKICLKGNNVFLVDLPNPVRILPVKIYFRK